MFRELISILSSWGWLDTWTVIIGALAAMSCSLPGAWLLLRRQSLLGDALSHSILPGIVLAYLILHRLETNHWVTPDAGSRHLVLFLGAAVSGVLSAIITELIQRWGRMDRDASIGVVFTSMFALGLLLIRMFADKVHVDPGCVLYGSLENSVLMRLSDSIPIPQAAAVNSIILAVNGLIILIFFKELRLSTFDPGLAGAVGVNAKWIQLGLMTMTAATLVAAFESVGAILVIAMLIVPAAAARLLTDRLGTMLIFTLIIAALSALLGHVGAITIPSMLFSRLGYTDIHDASTAGMMAIAVGGIFIVTILASPRHGLIRKTMDRLRLKIRIAGEDRLGSLFRRDELAGANSISPQEIELSQRSAGTWFDWLVLRHLIRHRLITAASPSATLTDRGRDLARNLVRSHRLWEAYMARHFDLPGDHLHATAEEVEHFLSPELQKELAIELDQPTLDPHGKSIPRPS